MNHQSQPLTQFQDPFSEEVWRTTYKDHKDNTVDDTFRRVAKAIASVEETPELKAEWEAKFFDMMSDFKGIPGGRILSNAGTEWSGTTLMNCFVTPRPSNDLDSLDSIIQNIRDQAFTLKSEGGWGANFSPLRPRGSFIQGIGVESPGAVKYMEIFDKVSDVITSGSGTKSSNAKAKGKIRKGAMMSVLNCSHPDIVEFVTAKQQSGRLTKFNMSVNCSDAFMSKVLNVKELRNAGASLEEIEAEDKWDLVFPDTAYSKYKAEWDGNIDSWKSKGYPTKVYQTVSATWLWKLITESTYSRNEPGVLFLDRGNYFNPLYYGESINATNPCSEQFLAPGGVCCLGTLNLTQFIDQANSKFDLAKLQKYAKYMVRFLDNVNSYSDAPLPEYVDSMRNKRRIGCGVMGWGSALLMLKVRFGSPEAKVLQREIMETFAKATYEASIDLAVEKGKFTYCDPAKHAEGPFVKSLGLSDKYMNLLKTVGIRNSSLMSQQPNGNSSILANVVTGGIEPMFMTEYIRTVIVSVAPDEIKDKTPKWYEGEWFETELFKFDKEGDDEILKGTFNGTTYKIDKNRGLTKEVLCEDYGVRYLKARGEYDPSADYVVTTTQLSVNDHVSDLEGFAKWTDSSCSKTTNIPHDYPFEDFQDLYLDVYKTGYIKGFTTYRAGTMASVLSNINDSSTTASEEEIILDDVKLPDSLPATMKRLRAEGKKWYVTVILNEAQTRPMALFCHTNSHEKQVTTNNALDVLFQLARDKGIPERFVAEIEGKIVGDNNASKISRAISLNLRHGVLIKNIVSALDTVEEVYVGSFLFTIKKYLSSFIKDGEKVEGEKCQECGSDKVVYREGCKICTNCGSSKCG